MERVYESSNGNGPTSNDHMVMRHSPKSPYQSFSKRSLRWLDLRVFYVRVSKCETDESTPMHLTLNHVPLNPDTLLEVNGVRTGIYSDGPSTLLRRDRLDKKSEEATFVSTDSIRLTGSMKFEVFNKDTLLLYGVLELCDRNGCTKESKGSGPMWSMNCESVITTGTGFLKTKQFHSPSSTSPTVEVYVAGSFLGNPIILTRTLQPSLRKKQMKGILDSIPEHDATEDQKEATPFQMLDYLNHKSESEEHRYLYSGVDYFEGEDGELSWAKSRNPQSLNPINSLQNPSFPQSRMPSFLSKSFLRLPPKSLLFPMSTVAAAKSRLRGVVFDMDGTLTVPVIDFAAMYKAVLGDVEYKRIKAENPSGIDILHHIDSWTAEKQQEAYKIIADFEKQGLDRLQIMPGAAELCGFLDAKKIRRGLITRNVKDAVDLFHQRFGMMFSPALSREFRPYKPNPAPLLHICSTWDVQPNEVMMVGDSLKDDVACGKNAGALTCLLDENGRYGSQDFANLDLTPDFKVSSLIEVHSLLKSNFDLTP